MRETREALAARARAAVDVLGVGMVGDAYSHPFVHLSVEQAEAIAAVVAEARAVVEAQR